MHYNELKILILGLFSQSRELDSFKIRELLSRDKRFGLTDKAVEMALMRYWRQGLLARNRSGRFFHYSLTPRGEARLTWLTKK